MENQTVAGSSIAERDSDEAYFANVKQEVHSDEEMEEGENSAFGPHESESTRFESIHDVAAVLQDVRIFFMTNGYDNLVESCVDLEERVAWECNKRNLLEKRSTVLDHLAPFDTRPT